eukprot:TRINITY_DN17799_c0_g1_i1.p1 TRINITY_DN17799_c0_g1~~TRINITY_DN17799_c0_g1_i1.p1  ORF type:complete len:259 (+),score=27.21 TRINITY_DN17799_c0_g1_i1:89-865(+)
MEIASISTENTTPKTKKKYVSFATDNYSVKKFNTRDPVFALHLPRSASNNVPSRTIQSIHKLVDTQKVVLTSLSYNFNYIRGAVYVKNLSFEKEVTVRYSFDGWVHGHERRALYKGPVREFLRGSVDEFLIEIDLQPSSADRPILLNFAIRYVVNGKELWDNNGGDNYYVEYIYTGPSRKIQNFHMPVKPIHKRSPSLPRLARPEYQEPYIYDGVEEEVTPSSPIFRIPRCPSYDTYIDETNYSRYHMPPISGLSPFL